MEITPTTGNLFVEPVLASEERAKAVRARSGLYIPPVDNKHSFEGVPNQGIIYALPKDYSGHLKVGMRVVFDEKTPKGFKWDEKTLFPLKFDQIVATVVQDD